MRFANIHGRLSLIVKDQYLDIEQASEGRFGPDPAQAFARWDELREWASTASPDASALTQLGTGLGAPSPSPRQAFGVGANYEEHIREVGFDKLEVPLIFTKYASSLAGPESPVKLSGAYDDWEAEIVVVIGRQAHHVPAADAWTYVAGVTLGQDISNRITQFKPQNNPQHSLGKSYPGFGPTGPVLVTVDEFADPDDIAFGCELNGEVVQSGRTSKLIHSVPELIEYLSGIIVLLPGDIIFTGTPSGVGHARTPPMYLHAGDRLRTWADGIGEMTQTFEA